MKKINIIKKIIEKKNRRSSKYFYPLLETALSTEDLMSGIKVIASGQLTMSKQTKEFEKNFAKKNGSKYALMVNSGSSANLLAAFASCNPMRKNRFKIGDEVLIPSVCWPTSLWPIIQSGLKPIFVDVDKKNFNIDLKDLEKKISKKTKALMLIHVLGTSTNMQKLIKILKKNKIILIEDTCESIGARYKNKFLGTFGDFSTFSFYFSHQISSVEGGMICCKNKEDENIIKSLRSHGWAKDLSNQKKIEIKFKKVNKNFLFINSGFNLRPTDIQAAIGLSQFNSLDDFIKVRKINRDKIIKILKIDKRWKNQVTFVENDNNIKPSWFALAMLLNKKYKKSRNQIFNRLDKLGIENRPIISGNFLQQPAIRNYHLKQKSKDFPNANFVHEHGLFVGLKNQILNRKEIKKFADIFFKAFKN